MSVGASGRSAGLSANEVGLRRESRNAGRPQ